MQLLIIALLLLSMQKEQTSLQDLQPLLAFLQSGELKPLAESKPFSDLHLGNADAKAVFALFDALRGTLSDRKEEPKQPQTAEKPSSPLDGIADSDILSALNSYLS